MAQQAGKGACEGRVYLAVLLLRPPTLLFEAAKFRGLERRFMNRHACQGAICMLHAYFFCFASVCF